MLAVSDVRTAAAEEEEYETAEEGTLHPHEFGKLTFGDYPGKDLSYVAQALHHREPNYMADLTEHVRQHGIAHPVEIAHHGEDAWEVVGGHHRLAAAWKLGKPVPYVRTEEAGDYQPSDSYYDDHDSASHTHWRNKRREQYPAEHENYMRRGEADDPFKGKWAGLATAATRPAEPSARTRPSRGDKPCACCQGVSEHNGRECAACNGSGRLGRGEQQTYCDGQAQPRRRHWRQGANEASLQVTAWDDDDDDDDDDEGWDPCYHCQREHDPQDHAGTRGFDKDWDHILQKTPAIHRAFGIQLPPHEHELVHHPDTPSHVAAATIMNHIATQHAGKGHLHWADERGLQHAKDVFSEVASDYNFVPGEARKPVTSVVLHAKTPHRNDVEDDDSVMIDNEVSPHRSPEYEIPLHAGASVHLTGMSWRKARGGKYENYEWTPGPDHPWRHHQFSEHHQITAAWAPSSGIFAPTTGYDHLLFDGHHKLRPGVARDILERLDQALRVDGGVVGSEWQDEVRVYIAGGSASEWAGGRPNDTAQDLDILIGVDYPAFRGNQPAGERPMDDREIDEKLNTALREHFNKVGWYPSFGGAWDVTGYVNPSAWDVRTIKPYAAWDVTRDRWAVRPPHLPGHSVADFDPALIREARAVATWARSILALPEPARTREAAALWEHIHRDRSRAFSAEGEGWQDPGNLIEKWLAYAPGGLLNKIRDLVYGSQKTAAEHNRAYPGAPGEEWRNSLPPEHEDILRRWEEHPRNVTGPDRPAFRKMLSSAPQAEGPVYRGQTTTGGPFGKRGIMPLDQQVEHYKGMMERGETLKLPRHSSASGLPEVANGFGHTMLEIHHSGARSIGNSLHEAVVPPGHYRITHVERGSGPARAQIDGRTSYDSEHVRVRVEPAREVGPRTAVTGYDDLDDRSAMVCLEVPHALVEKVRGGVEEDPHITVVYLGKISEKRYWEICQEAAAAAERSGPLHGVMHGTETFPPSDASDGKTPAFVPAYLPGIGAIRRELEHLNASQHKDFTPHVTLAYLEDGDPVPPPHPARPLYFKHLSVKRGDQIMRFPLGSRR
jgi:2'-5' RNA ligase